MKDLEEALRDALIVNPPALDTGRLRSGALHRLAVRKARRAALPLLGAGGAIAVCLVLLGSTRVFAPLSPRAVHAQPPPFARFYVRAPLRSPKRLAQEITSLRAALEQTPRTDLSRADLLLSLGEAYDQTRRWAAPRTAARKEAAEAALENFRALADEEPLRGYAARDRALFAAAYLLYEEERAEESQPFFQRLLDEHPGSPLAPEAAVGRAESFFERGEMRAAVRYYQLAAEHPGSPLLGYALYKIGWAHINLHEPAQAIGTFERVLDLGARGKLPPTDTALLVRESRKGLERARRAP